jgi:hypothetical protein
MTALPCSPPFVSLRFLAEMTDRAAHWQFSRSTDTGFSASVLDWMRAGKKSPRPGATPSRDGLLAAVER